MVISTKKSRRLIIIVWVVFLIISNTIFFSVRDRLYTEAAQKKLKEQSHGLLQQLRGYLRIALFEAPYAAIIPVRALAGIIHDKRFCHFRSPLPYLL